MRAVRIAAVVIGLALALAPRPAAAEGPLPTPSPRLPDVVLRHVDAPQLEVATHAPRRVVLLVGGFASSPGDPLWDDLEHRMAAAGYDVRRFGADPRFAYDTTGRVSDNARVLRDELHALGAEYDEIDIVAHSMGGVVADAALADGVGREDHVVTYVALAAPHSGSSLAIVVQTALAVAGDARPDMVELFGRAIDLPAVRQVDTPAVRDLARVTAPPAPAGIVRLDLREATDVTVGGADAVARGVPSLTLASTAADGHGWVLGDPDTIGLVQRTIATRRVATDPRAAALAAAGAVEDGIVGGARTMALGCLLVLGCGVAVGLRLHRAARTALAPLVRPIGEAIRERRAWI